jgi:ubiquinone/menaquinone biosynthesis C-methylase UbiE
MNKYLEEAEKYAREYDREAAGQGYLGPQLLFGLLFEYLAKKDRVLDLAIGTGLDAALFSKAGSRVYGLDGAAEMLRICREKRVATELVQADLLQEPIPYPDGFFDLSVCNSLFHMIDDPTPIFMETSRVLKEKGIFGFTFDESLDWKSKDFQSTRLAGVSTMKHPESGMKMYRHTGEFIQSALQRSGFKTIGRTVFLTFRGKEETADFYFTACIARKEKLNSSTP